MSGAEQAAKRIVRRERGSKSFSLFLFSRFFTRASLSPFIPCRELHGKSPAMQVKFFAKQKQQTREKRNFKKSSTTEDLLPQSRT